MHPVSVSEIGNYIKKVLRDDLLLSNVTVRGELSSFTETARGHCFFRIKDASAVLKCVMFKRCSDPHMKEHIGMEVDVGGRIGAYPAGSEYQLIADSIVLHQPGVLFQELEMRKKKLQSEGLFATDKKRPIPAVPYRIGLITSDTGAAITDLVHVIRRRSPMTHILLYPSVVQGTNAAQSMIQALRYFNSRNDLSTVIIGRGGGSFEDLFCFNDEELVREVARSRYPIISAVGHESDTVLTDFAADLRAPTPTAAGELATRHVQDLVRDVDDTVGNMRHTMQGVLEDYSKELDMFHDALLRANPVLCLEKRQDQLQDMAKRLLQAKTSYFTEKEHALALFYHKLEASNPLGILQKGYAVVQKAGGVVTDSRELKPGDRVSMRFLHGQARSVIEQAFEEEETDGIQGL